MSLQEDIAAARTSLPSEQLQARFDEMIPTIKSHDDLAEVVDRLTVTDIPDTPRDIAGRVEVSSDQLLIKLREAVCPPGKKGTWLRHLSDKQLLESYHRLRMGQGIYAVVRVCQHEWGVMRTSSTKSMARGMRSYRDKTVGILHVAPAIETRAGVTRSDRRDAAELLGMRGKRIVSKLDGLGRLMWLIEVQTDRVAVLCEREQEALPFKITGKEVMTLGKLLGDYMKLQMDLGLLETKPHEFNLNIKHKFAGLLQHSVQADGEVMAQAAGKYIELAEQEALTFELGEDGAYKLKEGVSDACGLEDESSPGGEGAAPEHDSGEGVRPVSEGDEDAGAGDSGSAGDEPGGAGRGKAPGSERLPE